MFGLVTSRLLPISTIDAARPRVWWRSAGFEEPSPDDLAELNELAAQIQGRVGGLSPRDATVITMVTHLGFRPQQIGTALGISLGAAKVLAHRARRRMRQALVLELMVRQPALACSEFRALLESDVIGAAKHADSCDECIHATGLELGALG